MRVSSVGLYAAPGYGKNDWQRNRMLSPPHKSHLELRLAKPLHTGTREGPAAKPNKPDAMRVRRDNALSFLERRGKGERREASQYAV